MAIQHLYSLDPLYGLFEKARKLAGVYWVEDIKTNTSEEINGIYVVNTLGDPFTDFDIDTISGGPVKDFNNVNVMGHFEYNNNTNKIVFIPTIPLLQIKFTYTKYTGKKATSNEIKGKDNQITVAPDANDSSSKIIALVDDVRLKGISISDDNDSILYSLPKTRGAPGSTLGVDGDNILSWMNPISSSSYSFATTDDINVSSYTFDGNKIYRFLLNMPLKPGNYTLPVSAGTSGQILITKGPDLQAEWASPSVAVVTINNGNNINVTHDTGYLISLADDVNIAGTFKINDKLFPSLSGVQNNSSLVIEGSDMKWAPAIIAGNNMKLEDKTVSVIDEPLFKGISIMGEDNELLYKFPQDAPAANNSLITHDLNGASRFITLSSAFGNEISNINGDANITVSGTGHLREVKLNTGIALGNVQINKTADEIQAPKLHITDSVKFGPYSMPTNAGANNNVLIYDIANSQAKWAAPVNIPQGAIWFSGDNGITITPASAPAEGSTSIVSIGLNTISNAKVQNLQIVNTSNNTIYSLPTTAGTNGQVLTASSNSQCLWKDPVLPTAGNGLVYANGTYSLNDNITLNTDPINVDNEIKIQLYDNNSDVTSLIKSKNASFQSITLGAGANTYTLPNSAGTSNKILGYDNTGQLGWLQRADAGVSAGNNIAISADSAISVVDAPLFSSIKVGLNNSESYTLPTIRPNGADLDYVLNYKYDTTTSFAKVYDITTSQDALTPINGLVITKDSTNRVYDIKLKDSVNLDNLRCNSITVRKIDNTNTTLLYSLPTPISIASGSTETLHVACISNTNPTVSSWCKLSPDFAIINGLLSLAANVNITTKLTTTELLTNSIKAVGLATEIKVLSNLLVNEKQHTVKNGNETVTTNGDNIKIASATSPNTAITIKKDSIKLERPNGKVSTTTTITADAIDCPTITTNSIHMVVSTVGGVDTFYKLPNTTVPDVHDDLHAWGLIRKSVDPQVPLEFKQIRYRARQIHLNAIYNTYPRADGSNIINRVNLNITFTLTNCNGIKTISFNLNATRVRLVGDDGIQFDSGNRTADFVHLSAAAIEPDTEYLINSEAGVETLKCIGIVPGIKYDAGGSNPSRCDFGIYIREYAIPIKRWLIILKRLDNAKFAQNELYKFGIDYDNLTDVNKSWGELKTNFTFVY